MAEDTKKTSLHTPESNENLMGDDEFFGSESKNKPSKKHVSDKKTLISRKEHLAEKSKISDVIDKEDYDQERQKHISKYREENPLKAWGMHYVADTAGPIAGILPKAAQEKLQDFQDYGDTGGVVGSLAEVALDPLTYIPVVGALSKANKIKKIISVLNKAGPKSLVGKSAAGGAAYDVIKSFGHNNLAEEEDKKSLLLHAAEGAAMGGAGGYAIGKVGSMIAGRKANKGVSKTIEELDGRINELSSGSGLSPIAAEKLIGKNKEVIKELSNSQKKKLSESVSKKTEETKNKFFDIIGDNPGATNLASEKLKESYLKSMKETKGLYDNLAQTHQDKVIGKEHLKDFAEDIASLHDKKLNTGGFAKDEFNIGDLMELKDHLKSGSGKDARINIENKQALEDIIHNTYGEKYPDVLKEYKSINDKWRDDVMPFRNNREIKNLGSGKTTELSGNFLNAKSSSNEALLKKLQPDDKKLIKEMIASSAKGDTIAIAKKFAKLPEGVGRQILGSEYDFVVNYPHLQKILKASNPSFKESNLLGFLKNITQKLTF